MMIRGRLADLRGRGLRGLAGRAGWNLADQVVTSATNLLLSVLAARALTAEGFGAFAVAFTIYTFLVAAGRAVISGPLTVRYAAAEPRTFRAAAQAATGGTVILGVLSGLVIAPTGLALGGVLGTSLLWMGVLMPGLLMQDMWRSVFITQGRPRAAFVNDLVWGTVQLGAAAAFILTDRQSASTLLISWGGAALVVAVLGGVQFRGRPMLRASLPWLRSQTDLMKYYFASFVTITGANQVTLLLIAGLGSPADVGALRAAQVVFGPLSLMGYALGAFAVPEIARRQLAGRGAVRAALLLSGAMSSVYVVLGGAALLLPDAVGTALLGDTWATAQGVLPAALLGLVAIAVGFGPSTVMMALGFAKETFRINWVLAPGFLVLGVGGLMVDGARGAALGLSLAQVVIVPFVWWRVVVLMRARRAADPAPASTDGEPLDMVS